MRTNERMAEAVSIAGLEVALTGRLFSMTRAEAVERIQKAGGRHAKEPGPATDILVAGEARDISPLPAESRETWSFSGDSRKGGHEPG